MAKLEGFADLKRKLEQLESKAEGRIISRATSYAMTPVAATARNKAPVGKRMHKTYKGRIVAPGFLKRGIRKSTTFRRNAGYAITRVGARREAFYGPLFVDLGTRWQKRNPFLRTSMLVNRRVILRRMEEKIRAEIRKVAS